MTSQGPLRAAVLAIAVSLALNGCGNGGPFSTKVGTLGGKRAAIGVKFNVPTMALVALLQADVPLGTTGLVTVSGPRSLVCEGRFTQSPTQTVPWWTLGDSRARAEIETLPYLQFGEGEDALNIKGPKGHYTFTLSIPGQAGSLSQSINDTVDQNKSTTAGGWYDPAACK